MTQIQTTKSLNGETRPMTPPAEPKSCGVLLLCGDPVRSFLLMKHSDRWDLPKGHVDPGETEIQCALREMEEETGISRDDVQLDPVFRHTQYYEVRASRYGGSKEAFVLKTLVVFLGRIAEEREICVTEHAACRWFPWSPPRRIQERTIDPLLEDVAAYLSHLQSQHG
jgi:8-oxo-dGTP pyrophosphatase MutT (NUDIX family)